MKHLPPFDSLVAFDAVVRHKSMTRAAAELGLTQSAISHRVRRLEAFMSAPLLHRHNTGLQPTSAGEALVEGFDEVAGRRRSASSAMPYGDRAKPVASGNRRGVGGELARASPAGFCGVLVRTYPSNWSSLRVRRLNLIADLDLRILWVPASELKATSDATAAVSGARVSGLPPVAASAEFQLGRFRHPCDIAASAQRAGWTRNHRGVVVAGLA